MGCGTRFGRGSPQQQRNNAVESYRTRLGIIDPHRANNGRSKQARQSEGAVGREAARLQKPSQRGISSARIFTSREAAKWMRRRADFERRPEMVRASARGECYVQGSCQVDEETRGFCSTAGAETMRASEGREYDFERHSPGARRCGSHRYSTAEAQKMRVSEGANLNRGRSPRGRTRSRFYRHIGDGRGCGD